MPPPTGRKTMRVTKRALALALGLAVAGFGPASAQTTLRMAW